MEQRHGHYDEGIGRPNTSAFSRPLDQENFIGNAIHTEIRDLSICCGAGRPKH